VHAISGNETDVLERIEMETMVANATKDVQRETDSANHRKFADLGIEKTPLEITGATSQNRLDPTERPTSDADVSLLKQQTFIS
jgi:hypothetical protein